MPHHLYVCYANSLAVKNHLLFRDALLAKQQIFVSTMTAKLPTYALGRGLEPSDMPVVRQLIRETETAGNRWSTLILNITRSMPFQMRRAS